MIYVLVVVAVVRKMISLASESLKLVSFIGSNNIGYFTVLSNVVINDTATGCCCCRCCCCC